jgi:hypothetical protein
LLEEKELPFYLWETLAPEMQRESRDTATEYADKVVLECLDGFFSHVASMVIQGNKFICHVGVADGLLVCHWCLVIQDLMCRDDARLLHLLQGSCTAQDKFAAGVVLEGLRPQRVAVNIINDHDVFVAKAGDLWEMPI